MEYCAFRDTLLAKRQAATAALEVRDSTDSADLLNVGTTVGAAWCRQGVVPRTQAFFSCVRKRTASRRSRPVHIYFKENYAQQANRCSTRVGARSWRHVERGDGFDQSPGIRRGCRGSEPRELVFPGKDEVRLACRARFRGLPPL